MTKIVSYYEGKKVNVIVIASLVASIVISSFFILFSPDPNVRDLNALLMSAISIGAALVISLVQVYRYKKFIRKERSISKVSSDKQPYYYYDNNKMHFSICLFLVLWLIAQLFWLSFFFPSFYFLSPFQQIEPSFAEGMVNVFFFAGYASFGYFLYSLYYHFFRKEFDTLVLGLIGIIIAIFLVSVIYLIVTGPWGQDDLVYPILDALLIFPAILIFVAVTKISKRDKTEPEERNPEQRYRGEETKSSYPTVSPIWILLLCVAMFLSAIGDTGFAYSTTLGPDMLQRDIWLWNIIFNADHLCIAAALIGYRHFFSFNRQDTLQH